MTGETFGKTPAYNPAILSRTFSLVSPLPFSVNSLKTKEIPVSTAISLCFQSDSHGVTLQIAALVVYQRIAKVGKRGWGNIWMSFAFIANFFLLTIASGWRLFGTICRTGCVTGICQLAIIGDGGGWMSSSGRTDGRKVSDELANSGQGREQVVGG